MKRRKSELIYSQIVHDYVQERMKKTRILKHLGHVMLKRHVVIKRNLFVLDNRKILIEKVNPDNLEEISIEFHIYKWAKIKRNNTKNHEDPMTYLKKYFRRNESESGFSSDKRFLGGMMTRCRADKIEISGFYEGLIYNLMLISGKKRLLSQCRMKVIIIYSSDIYSTS